MKTAKLSVWLLASASCFQHLSKVSFSVLFLHAYMRDGMRMEMAMGACFENSSREKLGPSCLKRSEACLQEAEHEASPD